MLKVRLALMNFLEFAVWGAYLTCMGMYLGRIGPITLALSLQSGTRKGLRELPEGRILIG